VLGDPPEADITLSLSQPSYEVGDTVSFTLANQTEWVIQLPAWPPWRITDSLGVTLAPCGVVPIIVEFHPGRSDYWEWNQLTCWDGPQVPQGRYRLSVDYWSECCPGENFSVEAWFTIGMVPVEPTTWGRVKAVFRGN
jgi:hypothetical protein